MLGGHRRGCIIEDKQVRYALGSSPVGGVNNQGPELQMIATQRGQLPTAHHRACRWLRSNNEPLKAQPQRVHPAPQPQARVSGADVGRTHVVCAAVQGCSAHFSRRTELMMAPMSSDRAGRIVTSASLLMLCKLLCRLNWAVCRSAVVLHGGRGVARNRIRQESPDSDGGFLNGFTDIEARLANVHICEVHRN